MWKFIVSASKKTNWLNTHAKEVCFVGRSNVGKSSLINALANQKIARTSNTPGRTQLINYFENEDGKMIVDLPGYGFAKMPKKELKKMSEMVEEYFGERRQLIMTFCLIDSKIGITSDDYDMFEYLEAVGRPYFIVGTKADKAKQTEISSTLKQIHELGVDYLITSASKGKNINKLKAVIKKIF
ncbi:MAG: YihA family ribosome biogenesis GTP-binding protein [Mycoplasmatales bacterium]|nr:YihA family ribosome biogenesis GTP-binding protein [Mycoplasmatales bacterium]